MKLVLLVVTAMLGNAVEIRFEVRHERALKDHPGVLTFDDQGVSYEQVPTPKQQKKEASQKGPLRLERVRWSYTDIQQLWIAPHKVVLTTYRDRKWLLGVDKEYEFFSQTGKSFDGLYPLLKEKLDQRFVAAMADESSTPLWEIPVKLLGVVQGSEGVLQVGPERIVYRTALPGLSRTWRYQDIENISSSGPFQLTLTSFERAQAQYGSRKGFNFQLKQRLDEKRYELLWRRLNRDKGLRFLHDIDERTSSSQ